MFTLFPFAILHETPNAQSRRRNHRSQIISAATYVPIILSTVAFAEIASPFDAGFTNLQTLFSGTIAKVASLIAIVIGGYQFTHGEPGAKRPITSSTPISPLCPATMSSICAACSS